MENLTFACSNFGDVRDQLLELASAWADTKPLALDALYSFKRRTASGRTSAIRSKSPST
jgi:hypothetical protein